MLKTRALNEAEFAEWLECHKALMQEVTRTGDDVCIPSDVIMKRIEQVPPMNGKTALQILQFDIRHDAATATKQKKWNTERQNIDTIRTYNTIATLDTETTKNDATEAEFMYIWQMCINGYVIIGRTWKEWADFINGLTDLYKISRFNRLIIWVHNLGFDSALFLPRLTAIRKVFSVDRHKPLYIETEQGLIFRDSLIYSGYGLEETAKQSTIIPVRKKAGDIDYTEPRNSKTPLTEKEWGYCINDVTALYGYLYEEVNHYGDITEMPLTNTGKVREYLREKCLYHITKTGYRVSNTKYRRYIKSLMIQGQDEYEDLKWAFSGGYTHASSKHAGAVLKDVYSMDFTSSYPGVMCEYKYPSSSGLKKKYSSLEEYYNERKVGYWHIIAVQLWDVDDGKFPYEHYISASKCINYISDKDSFKIDNGRVISAPYIVMICTDEDLDTIRETYNIGKLKIKYAWRYETDYLPKPIIEGLLTFYGKKTQLKGIPEQQREYQHNKGMNNSVYGMTVQDPVSALVEYLAEDNLYDFGEVDITESIKHYNNSNKRFTFYPWGIKITSMARRNLWKSGIIPLAEDYVYSDTDSVKYLNPEKHAADFEAMNNHITDLITENLKHYKIDPLLASPKTIKGKVKPLGVWDYDGHYTKFKTLGAKRYIYIDAEDNTFHITIAGVNKTKGARYIEKQKDPFDFFKWGMVIPATDSGKTVIKYSNEPKTAIITDKYGNTETMHELAGIYLTNSEYTMDSPEEYKELIAKNVQIVSGGNVDIMRKLQPIIAIAESDL